MTGKLRVLVVGIGGMGMSHAKAYQQIDGYDVVGLVARSIHNRTDIPDSFEGIPRYDNYREALADTSPDVVSINTYPDTHAEMSIAAMESGAHVFVEKPLASSVKDAQAVVDTAVRHKRKLVVGYILRHHPSWVEFVNVARRLGKPLVMRMNLLQQSSSTAWATHKKMLDAGLQPIVDCGIHYVDVMCQMTRAKPISVNAIGARLSDEVEINNYGQLQIRFDDGSIGWYEAAYGPSFSETAHFVKDAVGPKGSVSIINSDERSTVKSDSGISKSADLESHTDANALLIHHAELDAEMKFVNEDELVDVESEPGHDELCLREQQFLLDAIRNDTDLSEHMNTSVSTLAIVLAADESTKTGLTVVLD